MLNREFACAYSSGVACANASGREVSAVGSACSLQLTRRVASKLRSESRPLLCEQIELEKSAAHVNRALRTGEPSKPVADDHGDVFSPDEDAVLGALLSSDSAACDERAVSRAQVIDEEWYAPRVGCGVRSLVRSFILGSHRYRRSRDPKSLFGRARRGPAELRSESVESSLDGRYGTSAPTRTFRDEL